MPQESILIERAKRGDNAAKQQLLQLHCGYIWSRARRFCRKAQDLDDYMQIACIGFLHGVERFNAACDCSLLGYARYWIDSELSRYRETDATVRGGRLHSRRNLREALGDYDGGPQDAKRSELDQILNSATTSLNAPMFDDADDWIDALPSDAPTPEVEAEHNEQLQALRERLCGMDQRTVDALLRGESTLDAIGKRHRISRERVRQIQRDGVAVLRRKFAQ